MEIVPYQSVNGLLFGTEQAGIRNVLPDSFSESKIDLAGFVEYRDYYNDLDQMNMYDIDRKLIAIAFFSPHYLIEGVPASKLKYFTIIDFFTKSFKGEVMDDGGMIVELLGLEINNHPKQKKVGCTMTFFSSAYRSRRIPTADEIIKYLLGG